MDRVEAANAIVNGIIAVIFSGVITIVTIIVAMLSEAEGFLARWSDPWSLINVFIIFACAYGLYKRSRTVAIILVLYFLLSKTSLYFEYGASVGLFLSVIFLYFYVKAALGIFVLHKIKDSDID